MHGLFASPNYVVRMHVDVTGVVFFYLMNNNLGTLYLGCEDTELTRSLILIGSSILIGSLILIGSQSAVTLRHYMVYFELQPCDFEGKIGNSLNSFNYWIPPQS